MKTVPRDRLKGLMRAGMLGAALFFGAGSAAMAQQCLSGAEARAVVQTGEVLAPGQIASLVRGHGAKLVDLKLCRSGGGYVYVLRVVTRRGRVREIVVNAYSGGFGNELD